jgi:hypothetical protein
MSTKAASVLNMRTRSSGYWAYQCEDIKAAVLRGVMQVLSADK